MKLNDQKWSEFSFKVLGELAKTLEVINYKHLMCWKALPCNFRFNALSNGKETTSDDKWLTVYCFSLQAILTAVRMLMVLVQGSGCRVWCLTFIWGETRRVRDGIGSEREGKKRVILKKQRSSWLDSSSFCCLSPPVFPISLFYVCALKDDLLLSDISY